MEQGSPIVGCCGTQVGGFNVRHSVRPTATLTQNWQESPKTRPHLCRFSWGTEALLSRGRRASLPRPQGAPRATPLSFRGGLPPAAMGKPRPGFGRAIVLLI